MLGTAQFGMAYGINNQHGKPSKADVFKVLECAWANGIKRFDTAPGYGSEALLGDFVKANGLEREFVALTKIPGLRGFVDHRTRISQNIDASRKRLNTNIDTLFLHDPSDYKLLLEDAEFFKALFDLGDINHVGISVYDPVEVERVMGCELELAFQFPFNLLDRRFKNVKMISGKRYARSIFLQGLLASPNPLREGANSELVAFHKIYHQTLKSQSINPVEFALSSVIGTNCLDYFVVGVNGAAELKDILTKSTEEIAFASIVAELVREFPEALADPRAWSDHQNF